tara:strand:+ start:991 stop:1185 length:195 start_codon:yes stop_codon:yes gene_type:complete
MNLEEEIEVVILCENCGHNRGTFVCLEEPLYGLAECNKCSSGVEIHLLEKYTLNNIKLEIDLDN